MYHEIAEDLIRAIEAGTFHDKLPTEQQLMKQYAVSRNTIRRAIDVVYQRGLLRRVQGSGYFINQTQLENKATLNLSFGVGKKLLAGGILTSKVVTFDRVKAGEIDLASRLRIDADLDLYRIFRLRYLNAQLYCYEQAYYMRDVIPFLSTDSINSSILDFVRDTYDIEISSSENFISQVSLEPDQAELLHAPVGTLKMMLEQVSYSKNNVPFNFSRTIYDYPGLNFYFHSAHLASN
ncbi:GntR family transcriptional regulator [Lacticaseibacillus mingshuiensis]|uniref:GntR family transcriptional regulator n=1 Tax=Lacticaseibacillus mingshuiensis TaxID=2799574 RepID=A0ABW4CFT5_9LACO|nr:GntR family transcriptional regulator [Lacticaseibacillus mingshuiensis]